MTTAASLDCAKPHVLRDSREHKAAVAEIDRLLDADRKRGSDGYERLEFLSVLVEAYEGAHDPIEKMSGTPESVVTFMLEQRGLRRAELAHVMGGKARDGDQRL
jgi:HTH-type transcriptional regulator / antitoxin HigA